MCYQTITIWTGCGHTTTTDILRCSQAPDAAKSACSPVEQREISLDDREDRICAPCDEKLRESSADLREMIGAKQWMDENLDSSDEDEDEECEE